MTDDGDATNAAFRPLYPEDADQGDPYLFSPPEHAEAVYKYYVYATGEDPIGGMAFPLYASNDLTAWSRLGNALETEHIAAHWAPCVCYVPNLNRPFVMLYSRSAGIGERAHVGHRIYRADASRPEGPFRDSGHVLTPNEDFAIDPDVYRLPDGLLTMAYAIDFVENEPYGTGIVEAGISEDLTKLLDSPRVLARPSHEWQVYDDARVMPWKTIPGIDWTRKTVRWHTVEAPVGGLVSPTGKPAYLYSGGCFFGFYAVGALIEAEDGLHDVTDGERNFVVQPNPDSGVYGPGHCSWRRLQDGRDVLMLHARFGSPDARRQTCLAVLKWDQNGLPVAEPY